MSQQQTDKHTELACSYWIRSNYPHNWPIALTFIATLYIGFIHDIWKLHKSSEKCIALTKCGSMYHRNAIHICSLLSHQGKNKLIYGNTIASTRVGYHQWLIGINEYTKQFLLGISGNNTYLYTFVFCKETHVVQGYKIENAGDSIKKIFWQKKLQSVQNGDMIIIKIIGPELMLWLSRPDCNILWKQNFDIKHSEYKIIAGLHSFKDSLSIIRYAQLDKDKPRCIHCGGYNTNDWTICNGCGQKF